MKASRQPSGTHVPCEVFKRSKLLEKYEGQSRLDRLMWFMVNTPMPRKEIAHAMKISVNSEHTYECALYRREKVHSRAELMHREIERLKKINEGLMRTRDSML